MCELFIYCTYFKNYRSIELMSFLQIQLNTSKARNCNESTKLDSENCRMPNKVNLLHTIKSNYRQIKLSYCLVKQIRLISRA